VWNSSDGKTWNQVAPQAPWGERETFGFAALGGFLWVYGGQDSSRSFRNDGGYSADRVTWTEDVVGAPWSTRYGFPSVTHNGAIWVLGGYVSGSAKNDVFSMTIADRSAGCVGGTLENGSSPPARPTGDIVLLALTAALLLLASYVRRTASRFSRDG